MSKLVAHMARMKKGNMSGIEGHNKRLFKNHSNKDIDISKSYLNYDLVPCNGSYLDAFNNEMDRYYTGKKAPRKDAVMCNEWIFSASSDFFQNLSADDEKRFFESCLDFMKERYGHVIYATIHCDESTPHMHLGMVPITVDGRLSNKSIFTRTELKSLHSDLYKHLTSQGFALEPPQPNDKQHLSVMDFKAMKQEERIAKNSEILQRQDQQYNDKRKQIDEYAKTKQNELKTNAQKEVDKINKYKADIFAEIDEREKDLEKREKDIEKREKDIEKRDAEVTRKERNFASKYNKAKQLVNHADDIEKRLDEKIGLYKRLTSSKEDTAILTGLLTSIKQEYGQSVADAIYDKAVNGVYATSYVDTRQLDNYKQFKRTVKSKQVDDLEI